MRKLVRRGVVVAALACVPVLGLAAVPPQPVRADSANVAKTTCQPGDRPETGLQGQYPLADRAPNGGFNGFNCNLKLLGSYSRVFDPTEQTTSAWATLDTYKDCAYYGDGSGSQTSAGGVVVVDVSDPTHPTQTDVLTTEAMKSPWEALRVNARRGLLVADDAYLSTPSPGQGALDVYDVSQDCRHPKLLFTGDMPNATGHEGAFSPDGTIFWMTCICASGIWPIDLTDPTHPKEIADFDNVGSIHGMSISDDGTRGYLCQTAPTDALEIVDTSDAQFRRPNAKARVISTFPLPDDSACQSTYPVMYGSRHFVIQYGELSSQSCPTDSITNFSTVHIIDVEDEARPQLARNLLLEVDDPANCATVLADKDPRDVAFVPVVGGGGAVFQYDVHHCKPDRLHDPQLLACEYFLGGLRVFDIRNPLQPKDLGYFQMGGVAAPMATVAGVTLTTPQVDDAISPPVIWADRGLVLWTTEWSGIHVARFEAGVYPFGGSVTCPPVYDYHFAQYNPGTACGYSSNTGVLVSGPGASIGSPNTGGGGATAPALPLGLVTLIGVLTVGVGATRRRR